MMLGEKTIELRQERSFSQKINVIFDFLRQNFQSLGRGLLFIALPVLLLSGAVLAFATTQLLRDQTAIQMENAGNPLALFTSSSYFESVGSFFVKAIIPLILNQTIVATVVYSYVLLYQEHGINRNITVEMLIEKVKQNYLTVIGSFVGIMLILVSSALLLIIPSIYLSVPLQLLIIVRLVEKISFGQAVTRCLELVRGEWWSSLGLFFIVALIQGFGGFFFQVPAAIYQFTQMFTSLTSSGTYEPDLIYTVLLLIDVVGEQLLYTLMFVTIAVHYFSLVEKREAKGLLSRIDQIGEE